MVSRTSHCGNPNARLVFSRGCDRVDAHGLRTFSKTFYFRAISGVEGNVGDGPLPVQAIAHGIVFSIWMLLFLVQTWLVYSNRVRLHRTLGYAGVATAIAVVVSGAIVTVLFVPRAVGFEIAPASIVGIFVGNFLGLLLFTAFVALAVRWRREPARHKRMMYFATLSILGPALAGGNRPVGEFLGQYIDSPGRAVAIGLITIILAYDFLSEGRPRWDTILASASTLAARLLIAPAIVSSATVQGAILAIG